MTVTLGGSKYLLHSKLKSGAFPDFKKLAAQIAPVLSSEVAPAGWVKA